MHYTFKTIGIIKSAFKDKAQAGRQPNIDGRAGKIIIYDEYLEGLDGLENFSHIFALYCFHQQQSMQLKAYPCFDKSQRHGIFASRYPSRPNPIGISILTLQNICENTLYCSDIDVLDGTPLLDIKPYVKQFDHQKKATCGWYDRLDWENIKAKKITDRT